MPTDQNSTPSWRFRARAGRRIVLRLGKTHGWEVLRRPEGATRPARSGQRRVGNTRLNLRVTLPSSGPNAVPPPADRFKMQFTSADTDGNGYLEMKEVENNPVFRTRFKAMDADNDGKLFLKEMLAFFERQEAVQKKAMASCVTVTASDQGKGILDLMDTVKDGRLGLRELRQVVTLLKDLDRDGDGAISRTGDPAVTVWRHRRASPWPTSLPGAVAVRAAPGEPGVRRRPTNGPLWFRKMDRNRDGDVSRRSSSAPRTSSAAWTPTAMVSSASPRPKLDAEPAKRRHRTRDVVSPRLRLGVRWLRSRKRRRNSCSAQVDLERLHGGYGASRRLGDDENKTPRGSRNIDGPVRSGRLKAQFARNASLRSGSRRSCTRGAWSGTGPPAAEMHGAPTSLLICKGTVSPSQAPVVVLICSTSVSPSEVEKINRVTGMEGERVNWKR
jgi:hypothetical protein